MDKTTKIRELNDRFRKAPGKQKRLGTVVITNGLMGAGVDIAYIAICYVSLYIPYTEYNGISAGNYNFSVLCFD